MLDAEQDRFRSHLCCHSDSDGFYVPVDFPQPLDDEDDALAGSVLGSRQWTMRELILVAPLIGIELADGRLTDQMAEVINWEDGGPLFIERQVWPQLYEVFRQSTEQGSAVWFA